MRGTIGPRATATARFLNRVGLGGVNHVLKRLLQLTSSDRLTVEADGFVIEGPAVAWRILNQLAAGIYKPFEVQLFKEALRPGMVVVDVGANVGYYTLVAARAVGESVRLRARSPHAERAREEPRSELHPQRSGHR